MQHVKEVIEIVKARDPEQELFHQTVEEVLNSFVPLIEKRPEFIPCLKRVVEPERMIAFRVPWIDRNGKEQVNRGFRVEFNSAIGPYKGGLRFHPTVKLDTLKFLGFEQIFKNSLTGLPMGGGKGGSDFDPKGKTDSEVMSFCQSFMTELCKYIGARTDVPAGDIGVGGREIGYMFGQYKRIRNEFVGVLTGKALEWGGSLIRPEATGYGTVYYAREMLKHIKNTDFKGKRCIVSGSGNVAQFACEKLLDYGAIPVTFSDSNGYIYAENGITREILNEIMTLKNVTRGRLSSYKKDGVKYIEGSVWDAKIKAELAFPCATQNEIDLPQAENLHANGCYLIAEGANMPSSNAAIDFYNEKGWLFGCAKAANCGGVGVSGLEMAQNSLMMNWSREEVDAKLDKMMTDCFQACYKASQEYNVPLYQGANIAGAIKVFTAMINQGCV
jgi:glutamate dehydrogenase (NADP+)